MPKAMNKKCIILIIMLCLTQSIFALSPNPRKLATKSGRLLTSYFLKERSDTSKLLEAKALIDEAISLDKDSVHFNVFVNKGKVYNEISINQKFKNPKKKSNLW